MSGGSFDYLGEHAAWKDDLWSERDGDLERMAEALAEYGPTAGTALDATRRVQALLAQARAAAAELADVWHAVEWHHSADWSADQALEAIAAYDKEPRP